MSNVPTVQSIYEAFGRGDVPFILGHLADDVRWDPWDPPGPAHTGVVPQLVRRDGPAGVGEFFGTLAELEFHGFVPTNLLEGGDQVAAILDVDLEVKATGTRFQDLEIHLWTFGADGKVVEFRHVVDTAKHLAANTS